jgi:hypothetical protein
MTMAKIQEITVDSAGLSAITFSSISQNFTHLRLLGSLRDNRTVFVGDNTLLRFNGDTATNYNYTYGSFSLGTNLASATSLFGLILVTTSANTANFFASVDVLIPNYSSTTLGKGAFAYSGYGDGVTPLGRVGMGTWNSTAAITSISITPNAGTLFSQYSQLTLYGIR